MNDTTAPPTVQKYPDLLQMKLHGATATNRAWIIFFIQLVKSVKNKFLFTMTAYPGQTQTTLGQLCTALRDSRSRPDVIRPGFEPGTVVTPRAPRCSAFDRNHNIFSP